MKKKKINGEVSFQCPRFKIQSDQFSSVYSKIHLMQSRMNFNREIINLMHEWISKGGIISIARLIRKRAPPVDKNLFQFIEH